MTLMENKTKRLSISPPTFTTAESMVAVMRVEEIDQQ